MAAPVVTSISPTSGPAGGGTIVTVTGTGLTGAIAVGFGSADATNIAVASDTQVIAVTPAGSGTVNVTVVTSGGRSAISVAAQFAYTAATAASGASPYYVDPALTSSIVATLVNVLNSSTSPDALEAQNILMRRMALEGDVIGSRVPPPKNITEIGGYFNMLATLKEGAMREQALAGILGVAGPTPAQGWLGAPTPLAMVSLQNDRPAGTAQVSIPVNVLVRSDFVSAVQSAVKTLHGFGATLPLTGPSVLVLPPGGAGAAPPSNILAYLGRTLMIAQQAALVAPTTDPIALVRLTNSGSAFSISANVLNAGANQVIPDHYDAVQCTAAACAAVTLPNPQSFVSVAPILAAAGFYPASPLPQPANSADASWATFANVTGLRAGVTLLGDELALLYQPSAVAASVFASMLNRIWNGTAFV